MKRVLLVMAQPPGSSGVQGLIYNKILPYLEGHGWEFHFAGPSPEFSSVLCEQLAYPGERLHYTTKVSLSRQFSVRKNRRERGSFVYYLYGVCQLLFRSIEHLFGHDSNDYLIKGLQQQIISADRRWNYDLIAGKSPDFRILDAVGSLVQEMNKPFVAMVVDPHGHRDATGFHPADPERQTELLAQCCGAMFMSPLTRERYIQTGMISEVKAYAFTDSYPIDASLYIAGRSVLTGEPDQCLVPARQLRIAHLGMLPPWRPVETLCEAVRAYITDSPSVAMEFNFFGYVYPQALEMMQCDPLLRTCFRSYPAVDYRQSHWVAEDADLQLVVIGPRHVDNQPSKFFEYLGHEKPVLVIGPPGNPIELLVKHLGIGIYSDVGSMEAILSALRALTTGLETFRHAYRIRHEEIKQYSAPRVAEQWCRILDSIDSYARSRSPAVVSLSDVVCRLDDLQ